MYLERDRTEGGEYTLKNLTQNVWRITHTPFYTSRSSYYHLLTKYSYSNLYARHVNVPPVGCCACSKESRQTYDEWDDVKRLLHARSVASIPNDEVARNDQLNGAKDTAQMWHNGLQNEQLAVNIVQTGVNLNA
jgi:hypothetical protein